MSDSKANGRHSGEKVRAILATNLSTAEKLLLIAIADHGGKDGIAFPSQATLAKELTFTDRGVRKLIANLKESGILTTTKRPGGNRVQYGIRWELLPTPDAKKAGLPGTPVPDTAPENQQVPGTPVPDTFCSETGTQFRSTRNPSSGLPGTPVPPNGKGTDKEQRTGTGCRDFGKWCASLDREEFTTPDRGWERFVEALELGIVHDGHKHNFLVLWIDAGNKAAAGTTDNAARLFIANLKRGLNHDVWFGSGGGGDGARELIRKHNQRGADDHCPEVIDAANAIADDTDPDELKGPEEYAR